MEKAPYTIQINSDGMGVGDQALRHKLIKTYLTLLNDQILEAFPEIVR